MESNSFSVGQVSFEVPVVGGDVKQTAGRSQARDIDLGVIRL